MVAHSSQMIYTRMIGDKEEDDKEAEGGVVVCYYHHFYLKRVERMGQGGSRAGRLTKEDVMFLKANTRYDEDTIQVQPLT